MKLKDIKTDNLKQLNNLLLNGKVPTITYGSKREAFSVGDLENLGYVREYKVRHGNSHDVWWELTDKAKKAKIKFKMNGRLYGAGGLDRTEPTEVDYT